MFCTHRIKLCLFPSLLTSVTNSVHSITIWTTAGIFYCYAVNSYCYLSAHCANQVQVKISAAFLQELRPSAASQICPTKVFKQRRYSYTASFPCIQRPKHLGRLHAITIPILNAEKVETGNTKHFTITLSNVIKAPTLCSESR